MSNWADLSKDSLRAAKSLHELGRARSAVSRAFFAAYAAVAAKLPKSAVFAGGRSNPSHAVIHEVAKSIAARHLDRNGRHAAGRILRSLQKYRVLSDYDPVAMIDDAVSLESVRDASRFLDLLGIR